MFTLLVGFGFLPVIIDILFFTFLLAITESEAFPAFPFALILYGSILYPLYGINPLPFLFANAGYIAAGIAVYFAIGVVWSIFSWFLYTKSKAEEVEHNWKRYKDSTSGDVDTLRKSFLVSAVYNPLYRQGISLSNQNNWKIFNWIVLWPSSVIWRFVRTITIDLGKVLLAVFGKLYDSITNSVTNKLN